MVFTNHVSSSIALSHFEICSVLFGIITDHSMVNKNVHLGAQNPEEKLLADLGLLFV